MEIAFISYHDRNGNFIYLLIIFVPDAIITTDNVKLLMVHDFKHEVHIADETL